jgi:hypothetical protein
MPTTTSDVEPGSAGLLPSQHGFELSVDGIDAIDGPTLAEGFFLVLQANF